MIVALDTDVLVHWMMSGTDRHELVRAWLAREVRDGNTEVGLVSRVIWEFLHVSTDSRRFERPLRIADAIDRVRLLWDARETVRLASSPICVARTLELMQSHRLGRKRILDTALVATLESAGVTRLATFNESDFRTFGQIDVIVPS